ncbi:hypothetical protein EOD41_00080 [Mucilaginibacter limnophilus]|uniref:Uncharacterized protein n=1 Tax=Mucilaginibacter limnophilus TaxID=1932778 RepID=A0A3S2UQW1_9SPHI|nr:hypothetical protein [Mucilaginibacter limnophilus]RVU02374.1 hypothetical protein EOD41_00080 [Mucilaginibacter limnophilus]
MEFIPKHYKIIIPEEPQQSKRKRRIRKRWMTARISTTGKLNAANNLLIERHFMKVRAEVRKL